MVGFTCAKYVQDRIKCAFLIEEQEMVDSVEGTSTESAKFKIGSFFL